MTTSRLAGTTRYGTAAAISADASFGTPTTAIVATGENYPDALAASTLAGANASAPIILTETNNYTTDAKNALAALKAKGVSTVTIVGGTSAVSSAVETAIKGDGFTTTRVAGTDRYETAAAIANAANTKSPAPAVGGLKTALIATGLNFPDALAGGAGAYANKLPLLLVNDGVPAATSKAITDLGIKKVVILGGTAAVSSAVEAQLVTATGNPSTRLAGTNRYGTGAAVGNYEISTLAFPATSAVLATGLNFPDALAAGPLAGQNKAPIVLTASLPTESRDFLDAHSNTISKLFVSGGTAAIDDATVTAAQTAAQNVANDGANQGVTTRPELTGAAILQTVTSTQATPTQPAGTYVRYTFDKALGTGFTPTANLFKVYDTSDNATTAASATLDTTNTANTSVTAIFTGLTTSTQAAVLSVATVDYNAVKDASGAANPEGAAPIGTAGSTPATAGITAAPDLLSVGGFRQAAQTGQTAVDFTFDQAAFVATSTGFHLVSVNNVDVTCTGPTSADTVTPSGGTIAGGNGTTKVTAICTNTGATVGTVAGTAWSASNVARGYVLAGAVGTAAGAATPNPLEASAVASTSSGPDLVSVGYTASTGTVIFTFDKAISNATGSLFRLYRTTGAEVAPTAPTATVNSVNATQVSITGFPTNQTNFVGGNVQGDGTATNSAVRATDGSANNPDEQGFTSSGSTLTPGKTAGPDLTGVALSAVTDAFGNTTGWAGTYTFDSTAATTLTMNNASLFHLYLADGTRWNGSTCTAGTGAVGSTAQGTVKCTVYVNSNTGANPPATAPNTLQAAVLGTVQAGAVTDPAVALNNPEGAIPTTGGNGTPAQ